jgi:histidine ammonia-lyase
VRGAMLLRLTGFLSGYAGVSPALGRFIADRLNDRLYPVVPGGVSGAPGEIVPLAHMFETLAGDVERTRERVASGVLLSGVRSPSIWS